MPVEPIRSLHEALGAVLAIDPNAKYRFVNHGSGTYSLDLHIDPDKMTEEGFVALAHHGIFDCSDEDDSHEERVRGLGINLLDGYSEYLEEHEARLKRKP